MIVIVLSQTACVKRAQENKEVNSPRRWKVEYQKNGKWVESALFDTRRQAQETLDSLRTSTSSTVVARVVPTDWHRWEQIGALSEKYESSNRASGTVSSGKGDPGGVSYGSYQLSSNVGSARRFVAKYYAEWFHGTKPGSDEFSSRWKKLAAERGPELAAYEQLFIAETHYQPFADRLRTELNLDLDQCSNALRDVAWSTSVQHGARNEVFHRALEKVSQENRLGQLNDREIIELVYEERGRVDSDGVPIYFPSSSPRVQRSVRNRFKKEQRDALKALAAESGANSRR